METIGGGMRIKDQNELQQALEHLLGDVQMRKKMGSLAREFVAKNRGALDRVVVHIGAYIGNVGEYD